MRVSGLVITHRLSEQGSAWLADLGKVVDELVAVVSAERAEPGVLERLRAVGAGFPTALEELYPSQEESREMIATCRGDWVLKVDHDEELSPEWYDPAWRQILHGNEFTHFWLPRRWVVPGEQFLDCAPWWPDWQLRLLQNRPEAMSFATQLHESMTMTGPGGYLRTLSLHHHDLWLHSRPEREAKARIYEELRPGQGLGHYYLYEDWEAKRSCLPRVSQFQLETELLRMDRLSPAACREISIAAEAPKRFLHPRELFWLDVEVTNNSTETLRAGAPHPFCVAYHWLYAHTREVAIFEGMRTALIPEVEPGRTRSFRSFVIAPAAVGDYVLQLTLVQEGAQWLESEHPGIAREFEITVR